MNRSLCVAGLLAVSVGSPLVPLVAQDQKPAPQLSKTDVVPVPIQQGTAQPGTPQAGAPVRATPPSGGNTWFPITVQDLGTFFGHGEAVAIYKWRNPTDKVVEWKTLTGSCQCAKASIRIGERTYELSAKPTPNILTRVTRGKGGAPDQQERVQQITIEPNEEGEVEVHLDMNGITGPKQASLNIHTTDPHQPQLMLNFNATGAQLFTVAPAEVNLNKMTWSESREFTVTVTSPLHKDWNIKRMDDAKAFSATWEKTVNNDVTSWTIKGKYGPVDGETGGGGQLKFYTDVRGESSFLVRVLAFVQGPLEVKPGGFLTLGLVRKGSAVKKEIVFEPQDGFKLEAEAFRFEKLTAAEQFITVTSRKDGEKLIVEIAISDQTPPGLLKGDLVVQLNHPLVKEKRIMFNGFVR